MFVVPVAIAPAQADLAKQEAGLANDAAKTLLKFAKAAKSRKVGPRAKQAYDLILEYDTEHKQARKALGFKQVKGEWKLGPKERLPKWKDDANNEQRYRITEQWVATSRMEIDQARLLVLYAAWKMDTHGKKAARQEISMIKVVVPNMLMQVLDRAIQCLGSLGVSDDTPIARMWRDGRSLRIADGPDEVHKMVVARRELKRFA